MKITYLIQKATGPYAGTCWVVKRVEAGSVTTDERIGFIEKQADGRWMPSMIGAKYPSGPARRTRREARELIINKHNAPTREESIAAELIKVRGTGVAGDPDVISGIGTTKLPPLPPKWSALLTMPAPGPEREDCRCAARIRGCEYRTIHDLYPNGECPDDCHHPGVYLEHGTKFNQFDISHLAAYVVSASAAATREQEWAVTAVDLWCKVTGLPRQRAIMVAAEIHNRETPTVAIVAPF